MSEQDTMRLVAEVVDKYSGPLKDLKGALGEINKASKAAHAEAAKAASEHDKKLKELHERFDKVRDTVTDTFVPALGVLGIGFFGVGEGIAKVTELLKTAGEQYNLFNSVAKRGGVSAGSVDVFVKAFEHVGLSSDSAMQSVANLGEHLDKISRLDKGELLSLQGTFRNFLPAIEEQLHGVTDRKEQMEKIFTWFADHPGIPMDQKRAMFAKLGIDPDLATREGKEVMEALERAIELEKLHPIDMKLMSQLDSSFTKISEELGAIQREVLAAFGPGAVKLLDNLGTALESVANYFSAVNKDTKAIAETIAHARGEVKPETGAVQKNVFGHDITRSNPFTAWKEYLDKPASFKDRFGNWDDKKQEGAVERGTTKGIVDGLRMFQNEQHPAAAGGIHPAAYNPDADGGIEGFPNANRNPMGGGFHDGGGYHVMSGGAGADPEGSNAANGVGQTFSSGKNPFDRARFRAELENNPALRDKIMRIAANEQGSNAAGTQAIIESMMNRAAQRHTSLAAQARWVGEGGYYAQGSMGRGALENPRHRAILERGLRAALANANTIDYATDNSSSWLAAKEKATGSFQWHRDINGESFFAPGRGQIANMRRWNEMHRQAVAAEAEAAAPHVASLRDHIRNRNALKAAQQWGVVGPQSSKVTGDATVRIDLNGFPKGTRTSASSSGLFKETQLNRGKPMSQANQDE